MKILLTVHGYPPEKVGGTETYTMNLARALKAGHDVAIFTRTSLPGEEYALNRREDDGVTIWSVCNTYSTHHDYALHYRNPHIEPAFSKALDVFRPDLIHFTYLLGGLSASYLPMAAKRGIRTVVTLTDFHFLCAWGQLLTPEGNDCPGPDAGLRCAMCFAGENPYVGLSWWRKWRTMRLTPEEQAPRLNAPGLVRMRERINYLKDVLNLADVIISPTRFLQNVYRDWGVDSVCIPFAIDKSLFEGFERRKSEDMRFGFIGRLLPLKGLHILLEALSDLPEDVANWRLLVYADDSGDEEKQYLTKVMKNVPDNIVFRGTFPAESIRGIYEDMDVLVMPSLWAENSPMALLFALHTRTPVVASDIGGVREVAGPENAFLYPPRDVRALRDLLIKILRHPETLREIKPVNVQGMKEHIAQLKRFYWRESS